MKLSEQPARPRNPGSLHGRSEAEIDHWD